MEGSIGRPEVTSRTLRLRSAPNPPHFPKPRSPEVTAERPERVLELLLAAWFGQSEIREWFRGAVEQIAAGADPRGFAAVDDERTAGRALLVTRVLGLVAWCLPAGRTNAEQAAQRLRDWRERDNAELDEGQRQLVADHADRDVDDLGIWAFEYAAAFARATAFPWSNDGKPGNPAALTSVASRTPWSIGAIALGRRAAGVCQECGKPLGDRRVPGAKGRVVRRDTHDRCGQLPGAVQRADEREKAIERIVPLLSEALARRGDFGTPPVPRDPRALLPE